MKRNMKGYKSYYNSTNVKPIVVHVNGLGLTLYVSVCVKLNKSPTSI